jgi:hypothetical protein
MIAGSGFGVNRRHSAYEPSSGDLSYKIANQQLGTFAGEFAKASRALLRTYI